MLSIEKFEFDVDEIHPEQGDRAEELTPPTGQASIDVLGFISGVASYFEEEEIEEGCSRDH